MPPPKGRPFRIRHITAAAWAAVFVTPEMAIARIKRITFANPTGAIRTVELRDTFADIGAVVRNIDIHASQVPATGNENPSIRDLVVLGTLEIQSDVLGVDVNIEGEFEE